MLLFSHGQFTRLILFWSKNILYKNVEAEISEILKNMPKAGIQNTYISIWKKIQSNHMKKNVILPFSKRKTIHFHSTECRAMWLHCNMIDVWAESGVLFDTSILLDTGIRNQLSIFSRLSIGVCRPLII